MLRSSVVVFVLASACKPPPAPQHAARTSPAVARPVPAEHHFAGRVMQHDGRAASDAIVIVSTPADGELVATARSRADGTFETSLPRGAYALTATTENESVYIPSVDATKGDVEIRLDTNCERFVGHLETRSRIPPDTLVRLFRVSDVEGDIFGAGVGSDGTFRACLPPAAYRFHPPDGFAERFSELSIPTSRDFVYRTEPQQVADEVPADMTGIRPSSAEEFIQTFPATTKLLALGESNHGTREFYEERVALVKALASQHNVRLLMIEAGYGEALALDDYVNGAKLEVAKAVQALGYWTWDTKTFLQVLADIRKYNAALPRDRHIHVVGFDIQYTSGSIKYLLEHAKRSFVPTESAALEHLASDGGKGWTTLKPEERAAVRSSLARLAATRVTGDASSTANRTALAAKSLLARFDMLETSNPTARHESRDSGMANMALDIVNSRPDARATLWAHLGHLSREYLVGAPTMGSYLGAALGDRYRVYGLLARSGSARAWDTKQEVGVVEDTLRPVPPFSVEAVLSSRAAGASVTYWTFSSATGEAARWLSDVHPLRSFGAVFMGEVDINYWDLKSFDGVILFDKVSPTVPTPTGERHADANSH